jgi:hypothetical protein
VAQLVGALPAKQEVHGLILAHTLVLSVLCSFINTDGERGCRRLTFGLLEEHFGEQGIPMLNNITFNFPLQGQLHSPFDVHLGLHGL